MPGKPQPVGPDQHGMVADPPCAACGRQSAHVELVAPGDLPAQWAEWDARRRATYEELHDAGRWRFIYDGPAAGSGDGHDIGEAEAAVITAAFTPPVSTTTPDFTTTPGSAGRAATSHTAGSTGT